jgi:hypothetical protein
MKIDGHWKNLEGTTTPFGLHLGALNTITGYTYDREWDTTTLTWVIVDSTAIWQKFHYDFEVVITKDSSFSVESHKITTIDPIIMDVKQWMEHPLRWNFNVTGGDIMSRRSALDSLARNGQTNLFRWVTPNHPMKK